MNALVPNKLAPLLDLPHNEEPDQHHSFPLGTPTGAKMSLPPTVARHWPGGIPSSVVIHSDGERNEQEEIEDSRGWLLFVKV